ncbi:unnamed protein product [Pleuronectes platessa]|uniref:Interferon/interleukin receptor domain-containing protein n=1 Tax=Pleuronectes platessa TaxID=8262 RepID=A0A9N7UUZ4_PLEPL|nr:unnamed protein product [Pleuronectes platessa]
MEPFRLSQVDLKLLTCFVQTQPQKNTVASGSRSASPVLRTPAGFYRTSNDPSNNTHCDLTLDLGSDSDYNVQVRGQCGSQPSAWAELRRPFNRRDTVLTVPEMKVSAVVQGLHVVFEKLPLTALVMVTVWRTGDELQAQVYSVSAEEAELEVAALQEGERYCVRAQSFMGTQLQSSSTDTQCVSITE